MAKQKHVVQRQIEELGIAIQNCRSWETGENGAVPEEMGKTRGGTEHSAVLCTSATPAQLTALWD
jgi:hypothetical protein